VGYRVEKPSAGQISTVIPIMQGEFSDMGETIGCA